MTDTAERIAKLAERLDPEPIRQVEWTAWRRRKHDRDTAALAIATPGAELGALVDLFDFALAGKGWCFGGHSDDCWFLFKRRADGRGGYEQVVEGTGPTAAAALRAAMEEV